jgi:hypothetical protein
MRIAFSEWADQINGDARGRACSIYGRVGKCIQDLEENWKARDRLEDLDAHGNMILKMAFEVVDCIRVAHDSAVL